MNSILVVLLFGCGGGDDESNSSLESDDNDSYSLERSIEYTTAYRGYCEFSDSSKREIMIETNDLDSDFIILIKYKDNGGYDVLTARAYISSEPITFSQYEQKPGTIDGGDQWNGEFSRDRKTVTGTIDGGQLALLGCHFTARLDNNDYSNENNSYSDNVDSSIVIDLSSAPFSNTVYSGQKFRYGPNDLGMNPKILTIEDSEYKSCTLKIEDSSLNWEEGFAHLEGYDDIFNVTHNDLKRSYGDYTFTSYGEPIALTLNYSIYAKQNSYVEFSINCSNSSAAASYLNFRAAIDKSV